MTEEEWLTCTDPRPMLEFLRGKASDRKAQLFAVACCRHIWPLLTDHRSRKAVEISETHADRPVPIEELDAVRQEAANAFYDAEGPGRSILDSYCDPMVDARRAAACVILEGSGTNPVLAAADVSWCAARATAPMRSRDSALEGNSVGLGVNALLLQDIFGNPFRPVAFDPSWRSPSVIAVAQVIYDQRRFEDLPILADALEEAGCTSSDILSHCCTGGEHARGCWAVDLVLQKK